jgi:EAL domain-containing protein (putative c-di-GMP-specific phosphodiesterase class I)
LGISTTTTGSTGAEMLLRDAEVALQRAKEASDVCVFYSHDMNSLAARHLRLDNQLREAIDRKQFVLHYQLKVDLATRKTVGVEALLRWRDPERGIVSPDEFIPALEESGLIVKVGRWAIEQAVSDIRWWQACHLDVPRVSVNVSWVELRQVDFVGKVLAAVGGPSNAAALHDLEITEGGATEDLNALGEKLTQLHDLGIGIIMDDFGTGHSSLGQLARLPVDVVKIDRSLVADMDTKPRTFAIVAAIIGLAKALGLVVLAEGVETEMVACQLQGLGCQQAQGFHFGSALPAAALAKSLLPLASAGPAATKDAELDRK